MTAYNNLLEYNFTEKPDPRIFLSFGFEVYNLISLFYSPKVDSRESYLLNLSFFEGKQEHLIQGDYSKLLSYFAAKKTISNYKVDSVQDLRSEDEKKAFILTSFNFAKYTSVFLIASFFSFFKASKLFSNDLEHIKKVNTWFSFDCDLFFAIDVRFVFS